MFPHATVRLPHNAGFLSILTRRLYRTGRRQESIPMTCETVTSNFHFNRKTKSKKENAVIRQTSLSPCPFFLMTIFVFASIFLFRMLYGQGISHARAIDIDAMFASAFTDDMSEKWELNGLLGAFYIQVLSLLVWLRVISSHMIS
jgi:hypothetical protein